MNQLESKLLIGVGTWRVLSDDQNKLLFKWKQCKDFHFFVTDLTRIWSSTLCKTSLIKLLNDSNQVLSGFESEELLYMALEILNNDNIQSTGPQVSIDSSHNSLTFRIRSQKDGVPVTIKLELLLGNADMFYRNVTIPLLESIQDLMTSQNKLIATISKKDREIDDYKQEGAKLGLKYLKTPIFDIPGHNNQHSTLLRNFESINIIESAISDYKEKEVFAAQVKLENGGSRNMYSSRNVKANSSKLELKAEVIKSEVNTNPCIRVKEENNSEPRTQPSTKKQKKRGLQF